MLFYFKLTRRCKGAKGLGNQKSGLTINKRTAPFDDQQAEYSQPLLHLLQVLTQRAVVLAVGKLPTTNGSLRITETPNPKKTLTRGAGPDRRVVVRG